MGFLRNIFSAGKLNADPVMQTLAQIIVETAEGKNGPAHIYDYLCCHGWSRAEKGDNLCHALSMTKIWRADLYPTAKRICHDIYVAL